MVSEAGPDDVEKVREPLLGLKVKPYWESMDKAPMVMLLSMVMVADWRVELEKMAAASMPLGTAGLGSQLVGADQAPLPVLVQAEEVAKAEVASVAATAAATMGMNRRCIALLRADF